MTRENTMKFICCFSVSFMSFFFCFEKSKIIIFPIRLNVRLPSVAAIMPRNAFEARFICNRFFHVLHIFKSFCNTQIIQPIIRWAAINVVNFSVWPFAISNRPRDPMRAHKHIIQSNNSVPRTVEACDIPTSGALAPSYAPRQNSGIRIVRKKFFDAGNFWMFHDGNMVTSGPPVKRIAY